MKIIHAVDYADMSRKAANLISAQIIIKPNCVLGLATGSTPVGIYSQLCEWYKKGDLDFSQVTTVNLDEYCGIDPQNEQSYHFFMHKNLFDRVNIAPERINIPDGLATDIAAECRRYDALIESLGGIDMQLLGIGHNGHIGFNEPGAGFDKTAHCVTLKQSTVEANSRFFASADEVPKRAVTMGIRSIMLSKKVLLAASGEDKKEILNRALFGPVTPEVPASILQLHPDLTVVEACGIE